jgi:putative hydrolase of the HAD superfamily
VVCHCRPECRLAALARYTGLAEAEIHTRIWEAGLEARCERGDLTLERARADIAAALGRDIPGAALGALWALAFEPDPHVLAIADALRARLPTGLLTNNGPVLLDILPASLPEVARGFDPVLFSCRLRALKPSPEIFRAGLARPGSSHTAIAIRAPYGRSSPRSPSFRTSPTRGTRPVRE